MLKKILAFVLVFSTLTVGASNVRAAYTPQFSVWDGSVDTSWAEENTLIIDSAADLAGLRNLVWSGTNFKSKAIYLKANIDLNNLNWKYGIGGQKDNSWGSGTTRSFQGELFGNGHIIKNLTINPNLPDASESPLSDEVIGKNISVGLFGYIASGTLGGLNLEDASITLPDKTPDPTSDWQQQKNYNAGTLIGLSADNIINGCTVKNVKFSGGWNCANEATPMYVHIGGMIGNMAQGVNIYNSYVNGADFREIKKGDVNYRAFKAGFACASQNTGAVQNVYAVNMKYDKDAVISDGSWYDDGKGTSYKVMRNYDSLIMFREGNGSYYTFGSKASVYTDKYAHARETSVISGAADPQTAEEFGADSVFVKPEHSGISYNTMINLKEFGIEYPVTAAEKLFAVKADFYQGDTLLKELPAQGDTAEVKLRTYNTTGSAQSFDVIVGKYAAGTLTDTEIARSISASELISGQTPGRWDQWQPYAYGVTDEELSKMNAPEPAGCAITAGGFDSANILCWSTVEQMTPVSRKSGI
ncbi:MAG: hypothetical protein J6N52_07725 [Clostridia bacterium]|nr:hypothetical protein [Clostridia bacterium]